MNYVPGSTFTFSLRTMPAGAKGLTMLWIPAGVFMMGSPEDEPGRGYEDETQFEVNISKGFWLGKYHVTQAQWEAVIQNNPSHFKDSSIDCPVEYISWHDAIAFCRALNDLFVSDLPVGYTFSLPTEAQWEYACRAGTQTIYHNGNALEDLTSVAWHKNNSGGHTHAVGEKKPNKWGFYDMHGNVMNWCYDSPSDYPEFPAVDWVGSGNGFLRSIRGGSWGTLPDDACFRCSVRGSGEPDTKRPWIGMRVSLRVTDSEAKS